MAAHGGVEDVHLLAAVEDEHVQDEEQLLDEPGAQYVVEQTSTPDLAISGRIAHPVDQSIMSTGDLSKRSIMLLEKELRAQETRLRSVGARVRHVEKKEDSVWAATEILKRQQTKFSQSAFQRHQKTTLAQQQKFQQFSDQQQKMQQAKNRRESLQQKVNDKRHSLQANKQKTGWQMKYEKELLEKQILTSKISDRQEKASLVEQRRRDAEILEQRRLDKLQQRLADAKEYQFNDAATLVRRLQEVQKQVQKKEEDWRTAMKRLGEAETLQRCVFQKLFGEEQAAGNSGAPRDFCDGGLSEDLLLDEQGGGGGEDGLRMDDLVDDSGSLLEQFCSLPSAGDPVISQFYSCTGDVEMLSSGEQEWMANQEVDGTTPPEQDAQSKSIENDPLAVTTVRSLLAPNSLGSHLLNKPASTATNYKPILPLFRSLSPQTNNHQELNVAKVNGNRGEVNGSYAGRTQLTTQPQTKNLKTSSRLAQVQGPPGNKDATSTSTTRKPALPLRVVQPITGASSSISGKNKNSEINSNSMYTTEHQLLLSKTSSVNEAQVIKQTSLVKRSHLDKKPLLEKKNTITNRTYSEDEPASSTSQSPELVSHDERPTSMPTRTQDDHEDHNHNLEEEDNFSAFEAALLEEGDTNVTLSELQAVSEEDSLLRSPDGHANDVEEDGAGGGQRVRGQMKDRLFSCASSKYVEDPFLQEGKHPEDRDVDDTINEIDRLVSVISPFQSCTSTAASCGKMNVGRGIFAGGGAGEKYSTTTRSNVHVLTKNTSALRATQQGTTTSNGARVLRPVGFPPSSTTRAGGNGKGTAARGPLMATNWKQFSTTATTRYTPQPRPGVQQPTNTLLANGGKSVGVNAGVLVDSRGSQQKTGPGARANSNAVGAFHSVVSAAASEQEDVLMDRERELHGGSMDGTSCRPSAAGDEGLRKEVEQQDHAGNQILKSAANTLLQHQSPTKPGTTAGRVSAPAVVEATSSPAHRGGQHPEAANTTKYYHISTPDNKFKQSNKNRSSTTSSSATNMSRLTSGQNKVPQKAKSPAYPIGLVKQSHLLRSPPSGSKKLAAAGSATNAMKSPLLVHRTSPKKPHLESERAVLLAESRGVLVEQMKNAAGVKNEPATAEDEDELVQQSRGKMCGGPDSPGEQEKLRLNKSKPGQIVEPVSLFHPLAPILKRDPTTGKFEVSKILINNSVLKGSGNSSC
ncbi:unnamed protein product [Amoebophrya sp. A120]|nr:unnamed protein product [Amoebophrya sp. A120]|eukprot:GSA120T00000804001.1